MVGRSLLLAILAATAVTGLAACGTDDGGSATTAASPPPPPPPPATQPSPPPPPVPKPDPAPPGPTTITIVVRDGKVVGGLARATVAKGDRVVLVVRSDIADEAHLHGYDQHVDLVPGMPARLAFTASLPGRFEVELEERGLPIADIEVRP